MTGTEEQLRERSPAIAATWHEVIAGTGITSLDAAHVRGYLAECAEQLVRLLFEEEPDLIQGQAVGIALANLHYLQPKALGATLQLLSTQLLQDLSPDVRLSLQPRLATILSALVEGHSRRSQEIILTEQENVRRAQLNAYRELQHAVRQSEMRYRALVESANQSIFVVDGQGIFHFMNRSAARRLGGIPGDFVGRSMWDLFPKDVADSQMASIRRALESGKPSLRETQTILQGRSYWNETTLQPISMDAEEYDAVLGIATDVTARKRAEEGLQRYSQRLEILHEIDRGVLAAESPSAIADTTLSQTQRLIPTWKSAVALIDPLGANLHFLAGGISSIEPGKDVTMANPVVLGKLRAGETIVVEDIGGGKDNSAVWQELAASGAQAMAYIPLLFRGNLIGALMMWADQPCAMSTEDLEVLREVASSLAIAIHNAQLLESERTARAEVQRLILATQQHAEDLEHRVRERTRELSTLFEISAIAGRYLDLRTVLESSLSSVLRAVQCRTGAIITNGATGEASSDIVSVGLGPETLTRLSQFVERENTVRPSDMSADAGSDRSSRPPAILATDEDGDFVCLPMFTGGQAVGWLAILTPIGRQFTSEEVALVASVADHIAGTVENARLRETAKQVAVMEERERLARELHDAVTQRLYSLTLFAEAARERLSDQALELVNQHLEDLSVTAQQALGEMRLMLYELRTESLVEESGLVEALRKRLDAVERRSSMDVRLIAETLEALPPRTELHLYRIAQEALNNTLKHAEATAVTIRMNSVGEHFVMRVTDNGRGFDPVTAKQGGGMGLRIMRERAEEVDGRLTISSAPGLGTIIEVRVRTAPETVAQ